MLIINSCSGDEMLKKKVKKSCDLAQSWSSRAPQLDIIIGLREETQWLTETRRRRNLQNCEATKTQKFSSSWATNLTYV